jgi:hypothetical protein
MRGAVAAAHRWLPQKKVYGLRANVQAIFCRRRHQPRRPPLTKIMLGRKFSPTAIEGNVALLRLGDVARK